jgi:D-erythrulose 1-phosphate 3-epimerase
MVNLDRTLNLKLGINTGFAINRFPEPEVWLRIVGQELGLRYAQLVPDILNPFWPRAIVEDLVNQTRTYAEKYEVTIESLMTHNQLRTNHLMHPNLKMQQMWLEWFKQVIDVAVSLGAGFVGSHFGTISVNDYKNPITRQQRIEDGIANWQRLAEYAAEAGLKGLFFETMSIPREMAHTIAETKDLLERVNDGAALPILLCLDIGHAPHPDERDPYQWVRELAQYAFMVHLQQTDPGHSQHRPFTPDYNAGGIVRDEPTLAALAESGAAGNLYLDLEIAHRENYATEFRVLEDLKTSVDYWRPFVPN